MEQRLSKTLQRVGFGQTDQIGQGQAQTLERGGFGQTGQKRQRCPQILQMSGFGQTGRTGQRHSQTLQRDGFWQRMFYFDDSRFGVISDIKTQADISWIFSKTPTKVCLSLSLLTNPSLLRRNIQKREEKKKEYEAQFANLW